VLAEQSWEIPPLDDGARATIPKLSGSGERPENHAPHRPQDQHSWATGKKVITHIQTVDSG
jgi:hypothetical protein